MSGVHSRLWRLGLAASSLIWAIGCGEAFTPSGGAAGAGSAGASGGATPGGAAGAAGDAGGTSTTSTLSSGGSGGAGGSAGSGGIPLECAGTLVKEFLFSDDFEGGAGKWTLDPTWQIGAAKASAGGNGFYGDPGKDHTLGIGNHLAGVNIGGNTGDVTDYLYLSTKVPLKLGQSEDTLYLIFWRWLNSDDPSKMRSKVEVGHTNGWNEVWTNDEDGAIKDSAWVREVYNVTAFKSDEFYIRFAYYVGPNAAKVGSWNIDDVRLVGCH